MKGGKVNVSAVNLSDGEKALVEHFGEQYCGLSSYAGCADQYLIECNKALGRAFNENQTYLEHQMQTAIADFKSKCRDQISLTSLGSHQMIELCKVEEAVSACMTSGVYICGAPHGSGKTTKLARPLISSERGKVVYMSHLQSIVLDAVNRLDLQNYQDAKERVNYLERNEGFSREEAIQEIELGKLAVCVDSVISNLSMWLKEIDLLIIDEVSQVFRSVITRSYEGQPHSINARIFKKLKLLISEATRVVVLDADINNQVLSFLEVCRPNETFTIFNVLRQPNGITVNYYNSRDTKSAMTQIAVEADYALTKGERVLIATDSSKLATELCEILKDCRHESRILLVNADTDTQAKVKSFLCEPNREVKKYDCLIFSPKVCSSISIEVQHFTTHYGFFTGYSILASDAIQMIRRDRFAKAIDIFVVHRLGTCSINKEQRCKEQENMSAIENAPRRSTDFDRLKNDYEIQSDWNRDNFPYVLFELLKEYGFSVKPLEPITANRLFSIQGKREQINEICSAPELTITEYNQLKEKDALTIEEKCSLQAFEVRSSYGINELEPWLVEMWFMNGLTPIYMYGAIVLNRPLGKDVSRDLPVSLRSYNDVKRMIYENLISVSGLHFHEERVTGEIEAKGLMRVNESLRLNQDKCVALGILSKKMVKEYNWTLSHTQIRNIFVRMGVYLTSQDNKKRQNGKVVERYTNSKIDTTKMDVVHQIALNVLGVTK